MFVVGFDSDVISEAVHESRKYSRELTGRDYVEKIVQVVYRIPPPTPAHSQALLRTLLQRSRTASLIGDVESSLIIDGNARNPRRMKRFINRLITDHAEHRGRVSRAEPPAHAR